MVLAVIALLYAGAALLYIAINRKGAPAAPSADPSTVSGIAGSAAPPRRTTHAPKPVAIKLLEPAQQLFYEALKQAAVGHEIFAKIRVADLLRTPQAGHGAASIEFGKIANQHLDFIICRGTSLTVLAAIRLHTANSTEADAANKSAQDKIIRTVCKREKISLLAIKEKDFYDVGQLRKLIALL